MPYITREDGEHFVIPSYRDVLSLKNKSVLKRDILLLSQNYGEYITLQKKNASQVEIAFSPDTGYLLGESIWHYFKRPLDMIYCEAIPNTTEAILVIVKAGSVYLDGAFPLESIPEELVIFLTQQNNFEIYVYGDVPISETPEEGKFSFDAKLVKSFQHLDAPIFPNLPLLKIYQLQLVDTVLKVHGIGVFPVKPLLTAIIVLGVSWMLWSYFTREPEKIEIAPTVNPYQEYIDTLASPAPNEELMKFVAMFQKLYSLSGWAPAEVKYANGNLTALMKSFGGKVESLMSWAKDNNSKIEMKPDGVYLTLPTMVIVKRASSSQIYPLNDVMAKFLDKVQQVYPGNNLRLGQTSNKGVYNVLVFTINLTAISPLQLELIAEQLKDMPFVLQSVSLTNQDGKINGSITMEALGS